MIILKTSIANAINKSKKDFFFYDLNDKGIVTSFTLTNDYKRGRAKHSNFRVVSTIKPQTEIITIK